MPDASLSRLIFSSTAAVNGMLAVAAPLSEEDAQSL